ncbi:MAG: hypothetical protein ORN58_00195, partial [Sediminibacterium sp.]|nr:hypothetical protein [Sediminibacterium sp.]
MNLTINDKSYNYGDIGIYFENIITDGNGIATAIRLDFEEKQEVVHLYGQGRQPIDLIRKKSVPTGIIALQTTELDKYLSLNEVTLPNQMPKLNIQLAYFNIPNSYPSKIERLNGVLFGEYENFRKINDDTLYTVIKFKFIKIENIPVTTIVNNQI